MKPWIDSLGSVFVTGTDTGVGKTLVSSLLLWMLRLRATKSVGYFKPIQTGLLSETDLPQVQEGHALESAHPPRFLDPVYYWPQPVAPARAARLQGQSLDLSAIVQRFQEGRGANDWVVEGAGGLLVPLNEHKTIRDLIVALNLPLIVVASHRLGTLNHTFLTLEAAHAAGLRILGVVLNALNSAPDPELAQEMSERSGVEILLDLPHLGSSPHRVLRDLARRCMRGWGGVEILGEQENRWAQLRPIP